MPTPFKRFLRITPQQLRAFEATSRLLSITQAAKELHVTQPTISVQLREIADKVGYPLFSGNKGGGLALTPVGELLVQTEEEIGNCWQTFETRMADMRGRAGKQLSVCAETGAEYFLPQRLTRYVLAYPEVQIKFTMATRVDLLQKLAAGVCDVAVMASSPLDAAYTYQTFYTAQMGIIAFAKHPLVCEQRTVQLSELQSEWWLLLRQATLIQGLNPVKQTSLLSYEAICLSVAAGLGVALVPMSVLAAHVGGVGEAAIAPLGVEGFPRDQAWSLVWKHDQVLSDAAKSFMAVMQHQMP